MDIQAVQEELMAIYTSIDLPVLGVPAAYKHEPNGGFEAADLPAVVVTRGIKPSRAPLSSDRAQVTREFIADLYCYVFDEDDPVNETSRNNTADCIPSIETAFNNVHLLTTTGVVNHSVTADTADVELYARDTGGLDYIGVRFRHEITYFEIS